MIRANIFLPSPPPPPLPAPLPLPLPLATKAVETQAKGGGLATKALETKPKGISVCESKCLFRRENHPQNLQESWGIAVSFHVRRQNRARLLLACEKVLPDRRQDGGTI